MPQTPLIGVTGRRVKAHEVAGLPSNFANHNVDMFLEDYTEAIAEAGGVAINIPIDADLDALAPHLDGILLSGGTDVDPSCYSQQPDSHTMTPESERDSLEFGLLDQAHKLDIPVLGICRGLQIMNVFQGGTLKQNVPTHSRYDVETTATIHAVNLVEGSKLRSLYGASCNVNSLHHQTVSTLGNGLTVTATADDGEIEGIEMGESVLAVQWHPELLPTRANDPVFSWLVEKATLRASSTQRHQA